MPVFRRLSAEEVAAMRARRRGSVDLTEYSDFVRGLTAGEGGEIVLGEIEQKRTVKRRLTRQTSLKNPEYVRRLLPLVSSKTGSHSTNVVVPVRNTG